MQVVDFPHLTHVRLFWEALESGKANGTDTEDARNKARRGTPDRKEKRIISTHQDTLIFALATLI
jgi:hypothetical protein